MMKHREPEEIDALEFESDSDEAGSDLDMSQIPEDRDAEDSDEVRLLVSKRPGIPKRTIGEQSHHKCFFIINRALQETPFETKKLRGFLLTIILFHKHTSIDKNITKYIINTNYYMYV